MTATSKSHNYLALYREYQVYKHVLPQNVKNCLLFSQELQDVAPTYEFDKENPQSLLKKYIRFSIAHHTLLIKLKSSSEGN